MKYPLLEKINSPEDLRELDEKRINELCDEIRAFLIENVERTGGHLASNLGVVELTLALHRAFSSPSDKIIFDVGHQAYVHKLITGRREIFDTLRSTGGLSGFTKRQESEHDPFGAGHSSTSISAALGFAESNFRRGSDDYTVAVIGDGAFTGGMVHEALNNCRPDLKLIIILNENRMSISRNKGTFARYLARVRASERYMKWKRGTNSFLRHVPLLGKPIIFLLSAIKNKLKNIIYSTNYFEDLGLYYIGPVNGNEYSSVRGALAEAKKIGKCCIIHTYTKKGRGYEPAERSPDSFHSIRREGKVETDFHRELVKELSAIAEGDSRVCAITAAMGNGTGLSSFGEKYPDRYYDVGIAEAHAVTFAAGLAAAGERPYVAIYSTFLQRAYDNILHDVALQSLPVTLLIDRAGLAHADGPTHHGIFDISYLMHIPNVSIYSPASYESVRLCMDITRDSDGCIAIRYPDRPEDARVEKCFPYVKDSFDFGIRTDFSDTPVRVIVAVGCSVSYALDAKAILESEGIECGIVLVEALKTKDNIFDKLYEKISSAKDIVFVEEGIKNGGFSMVALSELSLRYKEFDASKCKVCAIDDNFASPEKECDLLSFVGISAESIAENIRNTVSS